MRGPPNRPPARRSGGPVRRLLAAAESLAGPAACPLCRVERTPLDQRSGVGAHGERFDLGLEGLQIGVLPVEGAVVAGVLCVCSAVCCIEWFVEAEAAGTVVVDFDAGVV